MENNNFKFQSEFARGYFDALSALNDKEISATAENVHLEDIKRLMPSVERFWNKYREKLLKSEGSEYLAGIAFGISRHGYGDGLADKELDRIATSPDWREDASSVIGMDDNDKEWIFIA